MQKVQVWKNNLSAMNDIHGVAAPVQTNPVKNYEPQLNAVESLFQYDFNGTKHLEVAQTVSE